MTPDARKLVRPGSRRGPGRNLLRVAGFIRRTREDEQGRFEAQHRLLIATAAAMACRDDSGGFRDLATIAAAIEDRGVKQGLDRVVVAPDGLVATERLVLYLVEDESSSEQLHLIVPLSERRFLGVDLRSDGDVAGFAGSRY
jgi:hypothetical protein